MVTTRYIVCDTFLNSSAFLTFTRNMDPASAGSAYTNDGADVNSAIANLKELSQRLDAQELELARVRNENQALRSSRIPDEGTVWKQVAKLQGDHDLLRDANTSLLAEAEKKNKQLAELQEELNALRRTTLQLHHEDTRLREDNARLGRQSTEFYAETVSLRDALEQRRSSND